VHQAKTLRTGFNLRLTNSQRACLSEIILLLADRARRRGIRGDPIPFLQSSIAQAAPGFPVPWANTLARYVATDPAYYYAGLFGAAADSGLIQACMMAILKDAWANQSDARKEAQVASEAAVQAQMSQILLRASLLSEVAQSLKSNH
jgi:hypothetical protein